MKTLIFIFMCPFVFGQFCGTATFQGTIIPNPSNQVTPALSSGRPYWTFSATAGCTYTFETCGLSSIDTELEILNASTLAPIVYNDDACGLRSRLVWTASYSGNYHIFLTRYNFGTCRVINSATQIRYFSSCIIALPISLISFTGENIDDRNILTWVTGSETNNDYFTLDRSIDGVYFEKIATVKALNTGSMYEFADETFENAVNYYRLSQTDFDGTLRVVGDIIAIDNREDKVIVGIFDLSGRRVGLDYLGIKVVIFSDGTREVIGGE